MRKFLGGWRLVVLLGVLLATAGVAWAAPVVLFDLAHDQRFGIEKGEPLQLSEMAVLLQEAGLDVRNNTEPLTDGVLANAGALIISGPFTPLTADEVAAVVRFVKNGGRLALMLHIASPFTDLLRELDVDFTNYVLAEQQNLIDGDPRNFQVKALENDPLFAGIDHFSLYGGWALVNSAPTARIIASTSPQGWVDLNGDGRLSKGDVVQAFGVVVSGNLGAGRFLVFGDDAIFQNKFLDQQNRQLAKNLAQWLKQ